MSSPRTARGLLFGRQSTRSGRPAPPVAEGLDELYLYLQHLACQQMVALADKEALDQLGGEAFACMAEEERQELRQGVIGNNLWFDYALRRLQIPLVSPAQREGRGLVLQWDEPQRSERLWLADAWRLPGQPWRLSGTLTVDGQRSSFAQLTCAELAHTPKLPTITLTWLVERSELDACQLQLRHPRPL